MKQFAGSTVRHGTTSGWSLHKKLGQDPCTPCFLAKQEYDRRWISAPEKTKRNRLHAKAQAKAYQRMAKEFPSLYRRYYEEFRNELLIEAGMEV